jgi:hypothetical protein
MRGRTIESKQVWQALDGQKTIWEVTLEADGQKQMYKTYSPKIAQLGFEGEITTYQSPKGDTFVKQPQQQGGYGGGKYRPRDDAAIRAQFAIKTAVTTIDWNDPKLDPHEALKTIERRANAFYDLVDRVKTHGGGGQA